MSLARSAKYSLYKHGEKQTEPGVERVANLTYIKPGTPGYSREKKGNAFVYLDEKGKKITSADKIDRIKKIVIPPAWTNVWICASENGHLQATGIDMMGRKQYRYHIQWSKIRNETKYDRMLAFGESVGKLRSKIRADLRSKKLTKEKVIAISLSVMQETFIRVGNNGYEKLYGSYGLTTLKDRHIAIKGNTVFFKFKGKKGIQHQIELHHASLAKLLQHIKDIPGHELFQYYDENNEPRSLDSGEVNAYIRACTQMDFTCKDFRTWAGTVSAFNMMADLESWQTVTECKKNISVVIDHVAAKLGNTRNVCKNYYIHPKLLESYEEGNLISYLKKVKQVRHLPSKGEIGNDEKVLKKFLKNNTLHPELTHSSIPALMVAE